MFGLSETGPHWLKKRTPLKNSKPFGLSKEQLTLGVLRMFGNRSIQMLLVNCLSWFEVSTMLVYVFTLHTTLDGDSGRSSSLRVGARINGRK